jgi:hypothetical protein
MTGVEEEKWSERRGQEFKKRTRAYEQDRK